MESLRTTLTGGTACDVCGRLPHPRRLRLTLAKLVAVAPVELALHAVVLAAHPPYLVAVGVLATVTTALVIWVVEPSTMRLLRSWLHAPKVRARQGIGTLWRIRVTLDDRAGTLESVTRRLAVLCGVSQRRAHGGRASLRIVREDPGRRPSRSDR